jgi:hypothetical protein
MKRGVPNSGQRVPSRDHVLAKMATGCVEKDKFGAIHPYLSRRATENHGSWDRDEQRCSVRDLSEQVQPFLHGNARDLSSLLPSEIWLLLLWATAEGEEGSAPY